MRALITGANGFFGYYLVRELLKNKIPVIATGKGKNRLLFNDDQFVYAEMDFTDAFAVHDIFKKFHPDVVVHAGAMSKPDDCEKDQWLAYVTNVEGTLTLLLNAAEYQSFFVFVSTDFVFDGEKGNFAEDEIPGPINYYGKTKLEAEEAVKEYEHDWAIVRTILVYGKSYSGRNNILTIVKEKLENGEEYKALDDQFRTPTYVEDLANGISTIIEKIVRGIFHLSGKDLMTPYQMASMTAEQLGLNRKLIQRSTAADFSQLAKRPPKTGFVIEKARRELGFEPVSFEEGLRKTFMDSE